MFNIITTDLPRLIRFVLLKLTLVYLNELQSVRSISVSFIKIKYHSVHVSLLFDHLQIYGNTMVLSLIQMSLWPTFTMYVLFTDKVVH